MRFIFIFSFIFIFNSNAIAAWVKDSVVVSVNTKDQFEIAARMPLFLATLNALSAENLASASKVTVQALQGEIANYRWENDSSCKIADPSKIKTVQLRQSLATFIYASDPQHLMGREDLEAIVGTPCNKVTLKTSFTKTK